MGFSLFRISFRDRRKVFSEHVDDKGYTQFSTRTTRLPLPCRLVELSSCKPHLTSPNIEDRQNVFQKDVSQNRQSSCAGIIYT